MPCRTAQIKDFMKNSILKKNLVHIKILKKITRIIPTFLKIKQT